MVANALASVHGVGQIQGCINKRKLTQKVITIDELVRDTWDPDIPGYPGAAAIRSAMSLPTNDGWVYNSETDELIGPTG